MGIVAVGGALTEGRAMRPTGRVERTGSARTAGTDSSPAIPEARRSRSPEPERPIPVGRRSATAGRVHGGAHPAHRLGETDEDRIRDDRMPDVELLALRDRGDGADVREGEAVTGVHREPQRGGVGRGGAERGEVRGMARRLAIAPGVELDRLDAKRRRAFHLPRVGIDEERGAHIRRAQGEDRRLEPRGIVEEVEPALGGDLLRFSGTSVT